MDQVLRRPESVPEGANSADEGSAAERGLRVRLFEPWDVDAVRDILRQHHATTVCRDQAFSDWKVNEHFKRVLSRMVMLVAVLGG